MGQVTNRFVRLRSLMSLDPATLDKPEAARDASADALIVDFGGVTQGRSVRPAWRMSAAAFVTRMRARAYRPVVLVRIGPLDDATVVDDLAAIMPSRPDGILFATCPDGAAVQRLGVKLAVLEAAHDITDGATAILAEAGGSAAGLMDLRSFRGASPRLVGLSWDATALADDIGAAVGVFSDDEGTRSVARTLLALGARAAEAPAFDTWSAAHGEALARECASARRLGFTGKIARDAAQVAIINTVFAPATAGRA